MLLLLASQPDSCSSDSTRLAEQGYGTYLNDTSFVIGRPEICINGSYAPFCTNLNQTEIVTFCSTNRGYYG